jgi:hypothetical protein
MGGTDTDPQVSEPHKLASARNLSRIKEANALDKATIGTYLPVSAASIFSQIVTGPDDFFQPPSWLLLAIGKIASSVVKTPTSPSIHFAPTNKALDHNTQLLTSHYGDLGAMLRSQPGTFLQYGTEFSPVEQIEQILGAHPNFAFFRKVLTHGMSYHFTRDLLESERVQELTLQLAHGNNKSASKKLEVASRLLNKDVAHGFSLPVHASICHVLVAIPGRGQS